ncbi:hypothetical protein GOB58_03205 [Acetobacter thailandicus]|nr:hypothetical protein [Acetobacter thailandicus]
MRLRQGQSLHQPADPVLFSAAYFSLLSVLLLSRSA